jgi:hypothetical protein
MKPSFRRRGAVLVAAVATSVLALGAPFAQAGVLVSSATSCSAQVLEQPFLPWLDPASYVLAPDGTFESGASGWSLSDASTGSGNESYHVHGSGESQSLGLPAGSSATSPSMCVGIEHPTLRVFVRKSSGSPLSALRVDVLFEDAAGNVQSLQIGNVGAGSSWQPTPVMPVVANLLALLPDEKTAVAFRFTALAGDFQVDDVYVDPFHK